MPLYVNLRQALIAGLLSIFSSSNAISIPLPDSAGTPTNTLLNFQVQAKPSLVGVTTADFNYTGLNKSTTVYNLVNTTNDADDVPPVRTQPAASTQAKVYRIMPLGDSNTEGTRSPAPPKEDRVAYRDELEELLNASQLNGLYDFVGSEKTGSAHMTDTDHAGFGGARDEDIATLLRDGRFDYYGSGEYRGPGGGPYLDKYNPDIILLHIGTNSVWDSPRDVSDVADILDQVDAYEARAKKEVTVILARIILTDGRDPAVDADTRTYNNAVSALVQKRVQAGDLIELVDMQDGAGLIYSSAAGGDMADQLHPKPQGYAKMAHVWFEALQKIISLDTQAPETTIAKKPKAVSNETSTSFAFTSDETGVSYEASLDGATYRAVSNPYNITSLSDGEHTLRVRAIDEAGNIDQTPASHTWIVDTKAPAAPVFTGISEDRGPKNNDQLTSDNTLRFLGKAEASAVINLRKSGAEIGRATANASGNWEFSYENTSLAQGVHPFTATATDAAGNTSTASTAFAVTVDLTAPEVSISKAANAPLNAVFPVEIKFTEEVYGLTTADFQITNGSISNLSASDKTTFTATVTPAADGKVQVTLPAGGTTDLAGNPNKASNQLESVYDATRPKLALTSDAAAAVNAPFTVTISFDEAVTGFELSDIAVANGIAGNFASLNSKTYTAQISPTSAGEVGIQVAADKAFDAAKNGNQASAILKRIYDVQRPNVKLTTDAPNPTNAPFTVTVTFSEPVKEFTAAQLKLTNASASQLNKVDDQTYAVVVAPVASGQVAVSIAANTVQDIATNGNEASNELKLLYDATRPVVTLSTTAPALVNAPFTVTFNISEAVTGFDLADISRSNVTVSNLRKVSEQEYTASVTPSSDGKVTVSVPADKMQDAANNGNTASNLLELTYDATAPAGYAVSFSVERVDVTNQNEVALQVAGAETGATYTYRIRSNKGGEEVTGSARVPAANFTVPNIDLTGLNDGLLTVTFFLTDAVGNRGQEVSAQVEKVTRNVETVQELTPIRVPFRTAFKDVPLPNEVEVTYANGDKESLAVTWGEGTYNSLVPATYTLVGELELKENTSNIGNKKASIIVEVEPNKAPTVLSLSQNTFRPDIQSNEMIGTFSTTDPDDEDFTYMLITGEGDTHNSLFEIINGNELTLKSNSGLSGISTFTIRVRSTDPYKNFIDKTFTLTKTLYEPQGKIKLVNAFSPDGDGINDTWKVPELRYYNDVEVQVFDRAGVRLFQSTDPEEGWDGRGKDGRILQGSYFYIIQVNDINLVQKGVVTVLK